MTELINDLGYLVVLSIDNGISHCSFKPGNRMLALGYGKDAVLG